MELISNIVLVARTGDSTEPWFCNLYFRSQWMSLRHYIFSLLLKKFMYRVACPSLRNTLLSNLYS